MTEQTPNLTAAEVIERAIPTAADIAAQRAGAIHPALPAAAETSLESGLQHVDGALAALFVEARAVTPADDPYGHARSRAYSDAIGLLKASAKVGHTVAELRGGRRFEHNINVHHSNEDTAASGRPAQPPVREDDDVEIPKGWYDANVRLTDGRVFVHGVGWRHPHPPQNSEGSNKPAEPAEPPKPVEQPEPRISVF
jgi:hypothetical protein